MGNLTEKDFNKACKEMADLFIHVEPYGMFNQEFFNKKFILYMQILDLFPDYKSLKLAIHHDFMKILPSFQN